MPAKFLFHAALLLLSVGGVFLWLSTQWLTPYTLQLVGILTLLYFGSHYAKSKYPKLFTKSNVTIDLTILTSMILLLVCETGALTSPLFFLCYFLLFAVAMLYEIEATLVLTGVLVIFFMFLPDPAFTQIVSLVMITPLAIFTGHQYEEALEEKRTLAKLKANLSTEETDTLMFLSLNMKNTLTSALDKLSLAIPAAKIKSVRTDLQNLYEDLKNLYRSADELQQAIDRETDK